jgi:uncharacterized protein YukE
MADTTKIAQEIKELLKALGPEGRGYQGQLDALNQTNAKVEAYNQLLKNVQSTLRDINNDLNSTFGSWGRIINEVTKADTVLSNTRKGFKEFYNISVQLLSNQENIVKTSEKELQSLQKKADRNRILLQQQLQELQAKKTSVGLTDEEGAALLNLEGALRANTGEVEKTNQALKRQLLDLKAINATTGLTGGILKGIGNIPGLSKIGNMLKVDDAVDSMREYAAEQLDLVRNTDEYQKQLKAINDQLEDQNLTLEQQNKLIQDREKLEQSARDKALTFGNKFKAAWIGINELAKGFGKALLDPLTIFAGLANQAGKIDQELVGFQKNLMLSRSGAIALRMELSQAALATNSNLINTSDLVKAQANLNELLGVQGKIDANNLVIQTQLTKLVGIQAAEAAKLQFFAEATGQDFEEQYTSQLRTTQEVSKQFGVQINQRKVLEEVGKQGAFALAQFRGSTTALTEAVAKATALGTTLEGVNQVASSLLNFEDSISKELEAELLIGREINLERARYFALTNDINGLMDELNKEMGTFSDFQNMNVIQQQALAESLGMNVGQLSEMLLKQEYLNEQGEIIKDVTDEELRNRLESLSTQEKFNMAVEKMQSLVGDLVQGPLGTFMDIMGTILENTVALGAILGIIATVQIAKMVSGFAQAARGLRAMAAASKSTAIANAAAYAVANPFKALLGLAVAGAAIGGIAALISNASEDAPGAQFGGEVTEGGAVRVGEVGPEIVQLPEGARIKPLNVAERGDMRATQTPQAQVDLSPMLAELKSLREGLNQIPAAISQIKMVVDMNRLEIGRMTAGAKLQ